MGAGILDDAAAISAEIAELRHSIHREPEIGLDLPKTQRKVLAALDGLPLEVSCGQSLSSVTAVLRGARPGRTRAAARRHGRAAGRPSAPACLTPRSSPGPCTPAAMTCIPRCWPGRPGCSRPQAGRPGGQRDLHVPARRGGQRRRQDHDRRGRARRGRASARSAAFALHVASSVLPARAGRQPGRNRDGGGRHPARDGQGRGGHGSQPHLAADPIPAACEMVTALQTMVTRRFDVFDPVVVTVGTFHAGTTDNVIPDEARLRRDGAHVLAAVARAASGTRRCSWSRQLAAAHGLDGRRRVRRRVPGDGERPGRVRRSPSGPWRAAGRGQVPGRAVPADRL